MNKIETFLVNFHNLDGALLKEKKKSLYLLIKSNESWIKEPKLLDNILSKLNPNTYLEEIYYIEILLYFRRTSELLSILKNGLDVCHHKIINQSWFVEEVLGNISAEEFVTKLLPTVSYSVRLKLIKKTSKYIKDEVKTDLLFDLLSKTYGLSTALILLPSCSVPRIKAILKDNLTKLTVSHLKLLFIKDPDLLVFYFEDYKGRGGSLDEFDWEYFCNLVAQSRPDVIFKLKEIFNLRYYQAGRRTTKKIVDFDMDTILTDPLKYLNLCKKDTLVRRLGNNFPSFFKKIFPLDMDDLNRSQVKIILKHYPKRKQYGLFLNTFQEVYGSSLWDNVKYMDTALLSLVPDKLERNRWIDKLNKPEYFAYYSIDKSIPLLQEQINSKCSVDERKSRYKSLVETCKINNDYGTFLDVLKYFCQRHRNSEYLSEFLKTVESDIELELLNEEHWKYIYQIIATQVLNKERDISTKLLFRYMEFMYNRGENIKEIVLIYLKEWPNIEHASTENVRFKKTFLLYCIELLPQVKSERKIRALSVNILTTLINWNRTHLDDCFPIHEQTLLLEYLEKILDASSWGNSYEKLALLHILRSEKDLALLERLVNVYSRKFEFLETDAITKWFVKYKPLWFMDNLDILTKLVTVKSKRRIFSYFKKYSHLNLPQSVIKYYMDKFEQLEVVKKRAPFAQILAYLMTTSEYIEFQKKYHPTCDKLEILAIHHEVKEHYDKQCALAKYFKLTANIKSATSEILEYCRGDYLGSALPSLYSICNRVSQIQVEIITNKLSKKAVGVRKHAIFLSCRILPAANILQQFQHIISFDKNQSMTQHVFNSCCKYFFKNSTTEVWDTFKNVAVKLNKTSDSSLKLLPSVTKFPNSYRGEYIQMVWNIYQERQNDGIKSQSVAIKFVCELSRQDIQLLPLDFCTRIIKSNLFKGSDIDYQVSKFAIKFLTVECHTEERLDSIFYIFEEYKQTFWEMNATRDTFYHFCKSIYHEIIYYKKTLNLVIPEFLRSLLAHWTKLFTITETFEEHMTFRFLIIKEECNSNLQLYSEKINNLFSDMLMEYGDGILDSFGNCLMECLSEILDVDSNDHDNVVEFASNLLKLNSSVLHCLLVIEIIKGNKLLNNKSSKINEIFNIFRSNGDIVEIYLNTYLKEENTY